jgi:hypothetical protein
MNTTGKKFGGRTKGAVNKTTSEIREHYQNLISNNLKQLNDDLKSLEPLQRLKIIIELSKFVVPTLKATELTTKEIDNKFNPITVTIIKEEEFKSISANLEKKY